MPLLRLERKDMQLKKIALVFLVVVMMFSLAAISIAAEGETSGFSISAKVESEGAIALDNGYVLKSGNDIKYVVSVDSNPGELSWLEIRAEFDNEILEFKGFTFGDLFDTKKCIAKPINVERSNENGLIQVMLRTEEDYVSNETGNFITLEFEVSEGFDGSIDKLDLTYVAYRLGAGEVVEPQVTATGAVAVHALDAGTKVPGDCLNVGTTVHTCTLEGCDYELVLHDGELGEHTLVKTENPGDCLNKATTVYTCSREGCEYSYVEEGELGEHTLVKTENPGDCKNVATTVHTCSREGCDYELVEKGELGNHNLVKVERVEPTYDAAGCEEHYKCSVCDKLFDAEGKEISYPSIPQLEKNNTAVTVIIIVVAVVVVAAGAAVAVIVLKKKKII